MFPPSPTKLIAAFYKHTPFTQPSLENSFADGRIVTTLVSLYGDRSAVGDKHSTKNRHGSKADQIRGRVFTMKIYFRLVPYTAATAGRR